MEKLTEIEVNVWTEYKWGRALEHKVSGKCVEAWVWEKRVDLSHLGFAVFANEEGFTFGEPGRGLVVKIPKLDRNELETLTGEQVE